jgi:hypothetical protein
MKEIWVVELGVHHEGEYVVSAWTSKEEAETERARIEADGNLRREYSNVYPITIGSPYSGYIKVIDMEGKQ